MNAFLCSSCSCLFLCTLPLLFSRIRYHFAFPGQSCVRRICAVLCDGLNAAGKPRTPGVRSHPKSRSGLHPASWAHSRNDLYARGQTEIDYNKLA
jgi:hypothetical protein